jgi:hypothetical protein
MSFVMQQPVSCGTWCWSELVCRRDLRVVTLYGSVLQAVGTDNAISTGPYEPCGLWSDAFWDHPDQPDDGSPP